MSHCNPSLVLFTNLLVDKSSRDQGHEAAEGKEKLLKVHQQILLYVSLNVTFIKNKGKRADVDIFGRLLWLPEPFGRGTRFSKNAQDLTLCFLLLVVSFKTAVRLNIQQLFEKKKKPEGQK